MSRILVCDDDREIVEAVAIYLEQEGYEVLKAYDGEEAIRLLGQEKADLLIIDVMMPKLGGVEATFRIREKSGIPIIILSAKSEDQDKIFGLKVGADDYVTKPFNPRELLARVQSLLRRSQVLNKAAGNETANGVFRNGGLVMNDERKIVEVDGERVRLTPLEYNILLFFMKHLGMTFSTSQIYEAIWNEESYGDDNVVAVHIRHIREKIEINPKKPKYLQVVWGIGYKMEKIE
ncbi:DNA-binding response regulator [bacterium D16-51]|nr:DNA-binding response regulator [bacterium D16-59]RKI59836.1 DNA-binding response regulator [bacterium D16-51]